MWYLLHLFRKKLMCRWYWCPHLDSSIQLFRFVHVLISINQFENCCVYPHWIQCVRLNLGCWSVRVIVFKRYPRTIYWFRVLRQRFWNQIREEEKKHENEMRNWTKIKFALNGGVCSMHYVQCTHTHTQYREHTKPMKRLKIIKVKCFTLVPFNSQNNWNVCLVFVDFGRAAKMWCPTTEG